MKRHVLFDDDLDGWGAAYAAFDRFGHGAEYYPLSHGEDRDEVPEDAIPADPARIYLLDYSWPPEQIFELAEEGHDVTVIDHHETFLHQIKSAEDPGLMMAERVEVVDTAYQGDVRRVDTYDRFLGEERFELVFNAERSSAALAWQYFHQSKPPRLLLHIEDRDLWNWDMDDTAEVLLGLESGGLSLGRIGRFARQPERLLQAGSAIKDYRSELVEDLAGHAEVRPVQFGSHTYRASVINAPCLQSEIGDYLLGEREPDLAIMFGVGAEGKEVFVSARSTDAGPHVGRLADCYGGGGHKNAAGFAATTDELFQ